MVAPGARRPTVLLAMAEVNVARVLPAPVRARLEAVADVVPGPPTGSFRAAGDALGGVEVLLTGWGSPRVTADALAAMPRLRALVHAAGTVKAVADPVVFDRGVAVSSAAAANAVPVAEFTVAAVVLAGKRAFRLAADYRRRGAPPDVDAAAPTGNNGSTVGVLGASRIGRMVIERLRDLAVRILVSDPYLGPDEARRLGAELCDLDTLFTRSDVVTVHAPLLPHTTGLVGGRLLARMRDGAVLINTARGAIVDSAALERECVSGRIDAVLDVTDPEPLPPGSPLLGLPNVFVTPHLAGSLGNEVARLGASAVAEIERYAAGRPFAHPVRPEDLDRIA